MLVVRMFDVRSFLRCGCKVQVPDVLSAGVDLLMASSRSLMLLHIDDTTQDIMSVCRIKFPYASVIGQLGRLEPELTLPQCTTLQSLSYHTVWTLEND